MKKYYKPSIFFFSLIPFFLIIYKTIFNKLGPEPVKEITHLTGEWTLLFIIFTLSMTPLKKITKLNIWISFRRMLGLFLFFYATLHMLTYVVIDYRLNFESISKDILTKKFIFVGFAAWVLLVPLALTSSKKAMIFLKDKWKKLNTCFNTSTTQASIALPNVSILHFTGNKPISFDYPHNYQDLFYQYLDQTKWSHQRGKKFVKIPNRLEQVLTKNKMIYNITQRIYYELNHFMNSW